MRRMQSAIAVLLMLIAYPCNSHSQSTDSLNSDSQPIDTYYDELYYAQGYLENYNTASYDDELYSEALEADYYGAEDDALVYDECSLEYTAYCIEPVAEEFSDAEIPLVEEFPVALPIDSTLPASGQCEDIAADLDYFFSTTYGYDECSATDYSSSSAPEPVTPELLPFPLLECVFEDTPFFDNSYSGMFSLCEAGEFDGLDDPTIVEPIESCEDEYYSDPGIAGADSFVLAVGQERGFDIDIVVGSNDMAGNNTAPAVGADTTQMLSQLKSTLNEYDLHVNVRLYVNYDQVFLTAKNYLLANAEQAVQSGGQRLRRGQIRRRARALRKALQNQFRFPLRFVNAMVQSEIRKALNNALNQVNALATQYIAANGLQGRVSFRLHKSSSCVANGYANITAKQGSFPAFSVPLADLKSGAATQKIRDLLDNEGVY